MARKLSHRVGPLLAGFLGPAVVRTLGATWRERLRPPDLAARIRDGPPRVYAFWHGRLLVPTYVLRGTGVSVMISRHADGEAVTRVAEALGHRAVRGSSTRGGAAALKEAVDLLRKGCPAGFTPDGPRGPPEVVQPGAVYAASRSGLPLVPLGVGVRRFWALRSWDRFRIPRPFTTVSVVEGEELRPPPDAGDAELEDWGRRLAEALRAADAEAERMAGGGGP